jgi:hemerythrin-like domain-containing protein
MARPLDIITAVHNASRRDITTIDTAALRAAQGEPGMADTVERFHRLCEILAWHAEGEDASVFPALEAAVPSVVAAYEMDHRGLDVAFDALRAAVSHHDPIGTARATAAFKFHLDMHLLKEDRHLYVLFEQRLSDAEQARAVAGLASAVPSDRFADFVSWLFPLLDEPDRQNVRAYWRSVMPPAFLVEALRLAHGAITDAARPGAAPLARSGEVRA